MTTDSVSDPQPRHDAPVRAGAVFAPIVLDGYLPPMELSPNRIRYLHWGTVTRIKNKVKKDFEAIATASGWSQQEIAGPRRRLTITMRRRRRMDPDGAYSICKYVVDGIRESGVLYNDSLHYLDLVVQQELGAPRTTLELEVLVG